VPCFPFRRIAREIGMAAVALQDCTTFVVART
jgi:hypothetical protein